MHHIVFHCSFIIKVALNGKFCLTVHCFSRHVVEGQLALCFLISALTPNYQKTNSPFMSPYFSYKSTGEKLLKYQANSPWVIISLILMTSEIEQALILRGEI